MINRAMKKQDVTPRIVTTTSTPCTPSQSLTDQLKGKTVKNNYLVGSQIGQGSFGMVSKVMDKRDVQKRPLAIKVSS